MQAFNWLDIVIGLTVLLSVLGGVRKGFSREIIGLAAALLGLLLASQFYRIAGQQLKPYISEEFLGSVAGFLIVFLGVVIAGAVLSSIVRRLLKTVGLSAVDRMLGAIYGLVRGSLVAFAIVMALKAFGSREPVVKSRIAPYLVEGSGIAAQAAPRGLAERIQRQYSDLKSSWNVPEQQN
jgi:membrane protein required for colicin V production